MHENSTHALTGLGHTSARPLSANDTQPIHRVDITPIYPAGRTGLRHRVDYRGEQLVASSRVPAFDAARALQAKGLVGHLEVWSPAGTSPRMTLSIEKAAKLTVRDDERMGPIVIRYRSWPGTEADSPPTQADC